MNLHQIVSGAIGSVNPFIPIVIKRSVDYTTNVDGTQVPTYRILRTTGQVQAMSGTEILRLNALNIQGVMFKVYLNGNYDGVVRPKLKGGDLFIFKCQTWLVVHVLENWPDWTSVAVVLQEDQPSAIT